ncbi:hypothetical protein IJG78_00900 [Candidatus Saccharibacteria bacterium]|nr:hypothetical protein [Candidatus Saccharibacteria bacterium]
MRLVLLWSEETDYASEVREWLRDFAHDTGGKEIESLDPASREGESLATAYDVLQFPAIMLLDDDGRLLQIWKGTPMPQIEQVAFWAKDV